MALDKKIVVSNNGPYLVFGGLRLIRKISIVGAEGEPEKWEISGEFPLRENYALCRCGKSEKKPYCDGAHTRVGFDGAETAAREKYLVCAEKYVGPELDLTDVPDLCSDARFCHLGQGTWESTANSDDAEAKRIAIQTAGNCSSGRLVVWEKKNGKPIEPKFEFSLSLTEDPQARASGPIWCKGGIGLESDGGEEYETRNRMTLCRCGTSKNKPFCDGSHIRIRFNDGIKT